MTCPDHWTAFTRRIRVERELDPSVDPLEALAQFLVDLAFERLENHAQEEDHQEEDA